jgi:hypothetical protein
MVMTLAALGDEVTDICVAVNVAVVGVPDVTVNLFPGNNNNPVTAEPDAKLTSTVGEFVFEETFPTNLFPQVTFTGELAFRGST